MEGPTPVSALIHAATMVTAGVFMVARLSPLFELSPDAQSVVIVIGATTALFAATVGLVQNDIKRIIAYSTCSQLGYMFVAMGVGAYSVGMFHLFTHAFFKALLFLGSGSVIIAMHHEQDIRHMGGLRTKIPFTYAMMVVGTLALTGFPLFAGYFSKDAIIEAAFASKNPAALYGFLMTLGAAGLTAFYSWRLIFKTFHGRPHDEAHYEAAHESPPTMLLPLFVLAAGSVFAGFPSSTYSPASGVRISSATRCKIGEHNTDPRGHASRRAALISALPTVMMALGFAVAWLFYIRRPDMPGQLAREQQRCSTGSCSTNGISTKSTISSSCGPTLVARPPAVEGRRRLADRRLRPRRGVGARPRRHAQRGPAADRLPLSLCLRHADRRRRLHHLVHVRGGGH